MSLDTGTALEWAAQRKHAVLITTKADGSPQSSDVVYAVLDGALCVSVTHDRAKTANMRRDPRIVLHVTEPSSWSYVSFSGTASLSPVAADPADATVDTLCALYEAVSGGPHDDWDEYRAAMVDDGRLVVSLTPDRAVGQLH